MTAEELLKTPTGGRISVGEAWLVWDRFVEEWVVYQYRACTDDTRTRLRTASFEKAIDCLDRMSRGEWNADA